MPKLKREDLGRRFQPGVPADRGLTREQAAILIEKIKAGYRLSPDELARLTLAAITDPEIDRMLFGLNWT